MPKELFRQDVLRLIEAGAQIVEVLEPKQYRQLHLPGAVNIPLWEIEERAPAELHSDRPVVVYCNDFA
ncbi:MAG TPA: rhodanese-like domain-containing protein [Chloroflexota bacterium]|nr:rhodanese-like domain-containing protein [Chloroflexota bacterium]